ncbi:MAG: RNA polymerase sigma-70 factor [Mariniphaga sp.]|nr:RNA polymerase sigma-70 factor [Mariniphaga sp.]
MTREEFKNTFDTHFNGVRNYIYYRSGDQEMATDVAQETFMKLWEKQPELLNGSIKAFLFKIAGDIFISQLRKQNVAMKYKAIAVDEETGESPFELMKYTELLRNYEKALEKLPDKQRTVFLLSRMDGLKYFEIADNLGVSVKAVEKRMKNALEYLRKAIGR